MKSHHKKVKFLTKRLGISYFDNYQFNLYLNENYYKPLKIAKTNPQIVKLSAKLKGQIPFKPWYL